MSETVSVLRMVRWILTVLTVVALAALGAAFLGLDRLPGPRPPSAQRAAFTVTADSSSAPVSRPRPVPPVLLEDPTAGDPGLESPFVQVARIVIPAVVSVEGVRTIEHPPIEGDSEDLMRRFLPRRGNGTEIEVPSSGSGFIVDAEGYILTNDHVVSGAERIVVHLADGRTLDAILLGADPGTDVAVLKVDPPEDGGPLPTLQLGNSDQIRVGDWAVAVGNPLGELESTLTIGVVSATGRSNLRIAGGGPTYQDFIQTDASINFGNSGGPLVNVRGEVWGINSAVNPTGQGLGFAIPINMAREVAAELIRTGTVRRGFLGIYPEALTSEFKTAHGVDPVIEGILVGSVSEESPAAAAGLRAGDVILEYDRQSVTDVADFRRRVAASGVGARVDLLILRDGGRRSVPVVLELRPDTPEPPEDWTPPTAEEFLGFAGEDIRPEHVQVYNLNRGTGVVLTRLDLGRAAERAGLRVGDVVLEVDGRAVADLPEFREALEGALARSDGGVGLDVLRGTARVHVEVRPEG